MNGKQLLLDALQNRETARVPWVPFVGCHAAGLIGVDVKEYFGSAEHIFRGLEKAIELYRPDGIPALFDLQAEAEALGCSLLWAKENPPSVVSHPLEDGRKSIGELAMLDATQGRWPVILQATQRLCRTFGDKVAIYGLVTGPFTLALHLRGTDIFYDLIDNPAYVKELMGFCGQVTAKAASLYLDAGVDVIAVVDPMTSQISPETFAEFVAPYVTTVFEHVKNRGKLTSFFVCGNAKRNIEVMCACKPDNISIDENIPLEYVKEICGKHGISFGGNIKLTLSMLFGTPADNINDAQNCISIGGNKGYVLAPGCDIPFAVPQENIRAIASLVHGEIAEFLESTSVLEGVEYNLPDYKNEKKVIVDVITLDSASCAPCQYMMDAVAAACEGLEDSVTFLEHAIKRKESVVCMLKLDVSNLPTICIDGEVAFVSLIPDVSTLRERILEAARRKQNERK